MSTVKLFEKHLKESGYSLTTARKTVFLFLEQQGPVAMSDIVNSLAQTIDRASVYRCMALFEELSIARRIYVGWKYKVELSDAFSHHHHHMTCLECSKIVSLDEHLLLDKVLADMSLQANMQIISHNLELEGYCQKCKAKAGLRSILGDD